MAITTEALEKTDRKFDRYAEAPGKEGFYDKLMELEAAGEIIVQKVEEPYVEVVTKYGRMKKIPLQNTWHHKSCGQCGHIPGYSTAISRQPMKPATFQLFIAALLSVITKRFVKRSSIMIACVSK